MCSRHFSLRHITGFWISVSLFALPAVALGQAPSGMAYVSDGTSASLVNQNEVPACDHWEIWLYKNGAYAPRYGAVRNTLAHWGTLEGSTQAAVEQKLKRAQKFDKMWTRFAGASYNPATDLNAENPVGPICITAQSSAAVQSRRNNANQMSWAIQGLEDMAMEAWETEPGSNEELRGYLETLSAVQRTQARIFQMLDKHIVNLVMLDSEMRQLTQQEASAQQMAAKLQNVPTHAAVAAAGPPPLGNWVNVNIPDRWYVQTLTKSGNAIEMTVVSNPPINNGHADTYTYTIPLNGIKYVGDIDSTDPGNGVNDGNIWFYVTPAGGSPITVVFPNIAQAQQAHTFFTYYMARQR